MMYGFPSVELILGCLLWYFIERLAGFRTWHAR
jgi:hypothetical protein